MGEDAKGEQQNPLIFMLLSHPLFFLLQRKTNGLPLRALLHNVWIRCTKIYIRLEISNILHFAKVVACFLINVLNVFKSIISVLCVVVENYQSVSMFRLVLICLSSFQANYNMRAVTIFIYAYFHVFYLLIIEINGRLFLDCT